MVLAQKTLSTGKLHEGQTLFICSLQKFAVNLPESVPFGSCGIKKGKCHRAVPCLFLVARLQKDSAVSNHSSEWNPKQGNRANNCSSGLHLPLRDVLLDLHNRFTMVYLFLMKIIAARRGNQQHKMFLRVLLKHEQHHHPVLVSLIFTQTSFAWKSKSRALCLFESSQSNNLSSECFSKQLWGANYHHAAQLLCLLNLWKHFETSCKRRRIRYAF